MTKQKRKEAGLSKLINVRSCNLHVVHVALQSASESTSWKLENIMKGTYQVLKDSPAPREDHIFITGSIVYPLQFCPVRSGVFFLHDPLKLITYRWVTIIKHLSQYL